MLAAERQVVHQVQLERVRDVAWIAGLPQIEHGPAQRQEVRRVLMAVDVARLRLHAAGEAAPQLELHRVVCRPAAVARHVRAGQRVRIDDEEVRRESGGRGVGAERRVADEPVLSIAAVRGAPVVRVRAQVGEVEAGERERLRIPAREESEQLRVRPVGADVPRRIAGRRVARAVQIREEDRQRRRARRAGVRERRAAPRRDVGLQVGLRAPELADEPVVDDVELVVVDGRPAVVRARADIAHFHRRVFVQRALDPEAE